MSKKILTAAGISLALLGGVAMPIQAFAGDEQAQPFVAEQDNHLTVLRDAETGKLRLPTAEEHAIMQQERAAKARNFRVSLRPAMQKYHRSGARGARVSERLMEPLSVGAEAKDIAPSASKPASPATIIKFETE